MKDVAQTPTKAEAPPAVIAAEGTHIDLLGRITAVDEKKRLVYAQLGVGPDKRGLKIDYEKSKPHVKAWSQKAFEATKKIGTGPSYGNVRAQHGGVVAGHLTELTEKDDVGNWLGAVSVTDPNEWAKVMAGDYTGVSWGADIVEAADNVVVISPVELSLVDVPRFPDATFTLLCADGTQKEMPFKADAEAATNAALDTLQQMKVLLQELGAIEGEGPEVWTLESAVEALRQLKLIVMDLKQKMMTPTTTAAAEPVAPAIEQKPPEIKAGDAPAGGLPSGDAPPKVEGVVSATEFRAVQEALESEKAERGKLREEVTMLTAAVETLKKRPAYPGRAPTLEEKRLAAGAGIGEGDGDDASPEVLTKRYEKLIAQAEASGMPQDKIQGLRMAAAEHILKLQTGTRPARG